MARPSLFILIAVIAIASFFIQPAAGQFTITIPKIKVPKVPKPDPTPASTGQDQDTGSSTGNSSSGSDSGSSSGEGAGSGVRGRPISGARITFSNNPDGSSPKTTFASSENIYGRIDFGGKTMYDAFGWKAMGDRKFYYVSYWLDILPAGKERSQHDWHQGRGYTLVTKEEAQKTYWNFDVLPDPAKASTLTSALADELEYYKGVSGMWPLLRDEDAARRTFPQNGTYTVDMTIYGDSYDDWGKPAGNYESAPTVSAELAFQFSGSDGQRLATGYEKAKDALEAAKNQKEMLHAMPDWWFKGATPPGEPKLAPARLIPLIKGFIGQWDLTYVKHMIVKPDGPLWVIHKNDLGIPEYRMVVPYIYVLYRETKDNSCQIGALYMRESYSGAGTYGEPYLGGIRDVQYIDCAAVK
jgi:hypothetical protein